MEKTEANAERTGVRWCKAISLGGIVSFLVALLLLLLISWGISSGLLGSGQNSRGVMITAAFASCCGTLTAGRLCQLRGPLLGTAIGLTLCLLLLMTGTLLYGGVSVGTQGLPVLACTVAGGAAAGTLTGKRKKKRRKKRSHNV